MARLVVNNKQLEVSDNSGLFKPLDRRGLPFGCQSGICGTCRFEILEGEGNLSPPTVMEQAMEELDLKNRLACQCRILKGEVRLRF